MSSSVTSPRRLPSEPPEPDLSHLTEEERQIIESVLQRQKAEAQKDQHMIRQELNDFVISPNFFINVKLRTI